MGFSDLETANFAGQTVFVRLDLNVPMTKDAKILDETRIQASLPTLRYLRSQGAKLVLASHLGRPKGEVQPQYSLMPVGERLAELLECEVLLVADYANEPADQVIRQLGKDQIALFENLRFHPGETANTPEFAKALVQGVDAYVNDAFGAAHRAHASIVGVPGLLPPERCFPGFLLRKELQALDVVRQEPKPPFTVVVGGAKVSDKIGVILKLLERCNHLVVGGAMAYTFLQFKGHAVGQSKVEASKFDLVEAIYRNAEQRRVSVHLPEDHVCAESFVATAPALPVDAAAIPQHLMGLDIGPKTAKAYAQIIAQSQTVLWNGPMGVFEWEAFAAGTLAVAQAIASNPGYTVVGGGESVAAAHKAGVSEQIKHVSTGGGASLEYLEGIALPGIKALERTE